MPLSIAVVWLHSPCNLEEQKTDDDMPKPRTMYLDEKDVLVGANKH